MGKVLFLLVVVVVKGLVIQERIILVLIHVLDPEFKLFSILGHGVLFRLPLCLLMR